MRNLDAAIAAANLSIPVSTAVSMQTLSTSYPPSAGAFAEGAKPLMAEIAELLARKKYPLLVNVYPYFARVGDPLNVELDYALFREGETVVHDGRNTYLNLFDAMTDAAYAALEKVGGADVEIVVSETGWPSDGGRDASIENAGTYVNNLMGHVSSGKGTPMRPGKDIQTYIFSMFNENQKAEGVEQHWGLHYSNLTPVYQLDHL
ncbi:LOW QUALITY PROTEIN: glucan endo-1,3-beta-glucosidase-like [Salvia miltiorrhiza]|uniref:LOW QUALITY PROTEIN: glucan endo-1,3-beta-glucosidase-like n=1 Tax=Salvia miltiorrhiza TaxID=226208 RepID=UPI0025ACCB9A|nr:LOW QUALITY PROTEIN: glucan endo-1,3-beta-glucosidase-like [Salvia miltiorrhiza]